MMLWLALFTGGAIGATTRFLLAGWIYARLGTRFPWGTLAVNVIGSFLMGTVATLSTAGLSPEGSALLGSGAIGAFTTFSTFAFESLVLLEEGRYLATLSYAVGSVALGMIGLIAGIAAAGAFA